jgi:hypothetical protein
MENAEKHKQMVGGLRKVFAGRNRAHVTKGRFRAKVRVIVVGVLTFAMGKLIRNAEFILVGKLCEIWQRNTGIYQSVNALLACNAFTAKNLSTGNKIVLNLQTTERSNGHGSTYRSLTLSQQQKARE